MPETSIHLNTGPSDSVTALMLEFKLRISKDVASVLRSSTEKGAAMMISQRLLLPSYAHELSRAVNGESFSRCDIFFLCFPSILYII